MSRFLQRFLVSLLILLWAAMAALLIIGTIQGAARASDCSSAETVLDRLSEEFGEETVFVGVSDEGFYLTVTASVGVEPSYTVLIVTPDPAPLACVIDFGGGWALDEPPEPVPIGPAGEVH